MQLVDDLRHAREAEGELDQGLEADASGLGELVDDLRLALEAEVSSTRGSRQMPAGSGNSFMVSGSRLRPKNIYRRTHFQSLSLKK